MNRKKIGILTFHCAENYGAFLQVYAMQSILQQINNDTDIEVIDYRPKYITEIYKYNLFKWYLEDRGLLSNIKSFIVYLVTIPNYIKRKNNFNRIKKLLNLSSEIYYQVGDFDDKKTNYDYLILGSDQIWNPMITQGIDPILWGNLPNIKKCKIISYAASLGISSYSDKYKSDIKKYIKNIDFIGLRESSSIKVLKEIENREYKTVLDPTFLLPKNFWEKFSKKININKYILIYKLENNPYIMEDAYRMAKENNLEIVSLGDPGIKNTYKDKKIHSISYSGPREFVGAIKNASIILTNSYHATCFSVIFEKNFYTYSHSKTSLRMIDLSKLLGFENKIISYGKSIYDYSENKELNIYININKKLEDEKIKSLHYIKENIIIG